MTTHAVPDAALQQHIAILGKTGSGKTYAAKGIVEGLLAAARRVVIVDPTGAWWGLRSSRDGKKPGFKILVLGGDHGDLPLPALGGAAVAKLAVDQDVSLVADTSLFTVGERTRWFIDFAGALYRGCKAPLHVVLDEAHMFAPQGKVPDPETGRMLHAANTLASGGRSRGLRLMMITQRPQKLHKDALTSAATLIALRVIAPQDRAAVHEWIKGCGSEAEGKAVLDSLAKLPTGEGWTWFPEGGHLKRLKFPPITTFDSSATPADGAPVSAPKGVAEIDLAEVRAALADAVKDVEANDPKLLRQRIARLEQELRAAPKAAAAPGPVKVRVFQDMTALHEAAEAALKQMQTLQDCTAQVLRAVLHEIQVLEAAQDVLEPNTEIQIRKGWKPPKSPTSTELAAIMSARRFPAREPIPGQSATLGGSARKFLIVLAQQGRALRRNQLAVFAGYSSKAGNTSNILSSLRTAGLIEGGSDAIDITPAGLEALGDFEPLPTGRALVAYWQRKLGQGPAKFLEVLCSAYPRPISREELAVAAGYSPTGGNTSNILSALRTRDLIIGPSSALMVARELID